ncbi:hypothetical protein OUZ56_011659 [Daphnia magna]|uniref:Uncharacterized protein n=1 Tax=Daphnia magna TaxID=35525 RepID=A0ABQ9Z225_9CRUS|nr:hypothetical protein OUZ56_011659 [Daphnia magna]
MNTQKRPGPHFSPLSICPSADLLPAKLPAVVARQPTLYLCPSTHSLPLPLLGGFFVASVRRPGFCLCPPTDSLPLPVDPLTAFARHITHSLCPSTPSLLVDALSVRQNARCSCPSTLSLPLPVRHLIVCARQPNPCICPSIYSQSLPIDPIPARQKFPLYLPVESLTVSARRPTRCPQKYPMKLPVNLYIASGYLIPNSLCPSTPSLPVNPLFAR